MLEIVRFCRSPANFFLLVSLFDNEWFSHHKWLRKAFNKYHGYTKFQIPAFILFFIKVSKKYHIIPEFRSHATIWIVDSNQRFHAVCVAFKMLPGKGASIDKFISSCKPNLSHFRYPYQLLSFSSFSLPFLEFIE